MHIRRLQLFVREPDPVATFYADQLGLPVKRSDQSAIVGIGSTVVTFSYDKAATPYHFAINIPSNQVQEAHHWLSERVDLLPYEGNDIVDFANWNAEAVYFCDPANNIVELIARHNLKAESTAPFSAKSLLSVSEIGIAPDSLEQAISTLVQQCKLEVFDGGSQRFCAIGDEHGLFIAVDRNQKGWMPTDDEVFPSTLELIMETDDRVWRVEFDGRRIFCHSANFLS